MKFIGKVLRSIVMLLPKGGKRLARFFISPAFGAILISVASLLAGLFALKWVVGQLDDWTGADFKTPEDLSAAIRNVGLVVAALVSVPFVVWRTSVAQAQAKTATDSLFNDKINAASEDLHAMRQRSVVKEDGSSSETIWEADVTRRNAAIDRLEGLVKERPEEATRVARLLSVYVRELSREFPAKVLPVDLDPEGLKTWAEKLEPARSDFQTAVSTLGRLRELDPRVTLEKDAIDLRDANLQGLDLGHLNLHDAMLHGALLQGADLRWAQLQGVDLSVAQLQRADLRWAQLQGANLGGAQLQGANLGSAQLQGAILLGAQMQEGKLHGAQLQRGKLAGAQLRGADLSSALLQGANLFRAQMQGADISWAQLQGASLDQALLQGANLFGAEFDGLTDISSASLRGAALSSDDLSAVRIIQTQVDSALGDKSVILPKGIQRPRHWPDEDLEYGEFIEAWRAWQHSIGFDPDDPSTWYDPKDT